jgi:tetratricopeptide repeat protein/polysaccharide lyase family 4-like protein
LRLATAALLVALLGLTACQKSVGPAPAANIAVDHAAEARKAFDARDWEAAAAHFRTAIASDPDALALHYGLAICASWLSLLDEATVEFQWVLAHAPGASDEARAAREWLAGITSPSPSDVATAPVDPDDPKVGDAAIHCLATWDTTGANEVLPRAQLHLKGLPDGPTKGLSYYVRTDMEGRYQFNSIKAGSYRLTDAIAGPTKWNLKVTVASGERLELELSTRNSVSSRNDFPSTSI